jgi:hypothetical protein
MRIHKKRKGGLAMIKKIIRWLVRLVKYGKRHPFWLGIYEFEYRDRYGNLIERWVVENALADEGEENILNSYLRATSSPTTFYLALFNDTPIETDSMDDLTGEPGTNHYERQEITRDATGWPTLALDSGDFMATSKQVVFDATGGPWGPVIYMVLTTTLSGTAGLLLSYVALSQSRTLLEDETLGCKMKIKLQ